MTDQPKAPGLPPADLDAIDALWGQRIAAANTIACQHYIEWKDGEFERVSASLSNANNAIAKEWPALRDELRAHRADTYLDVLTDTSVALGDLVDAGQHYWEIPAIVTKLVTELRALRRLRDAVLARRAALRAYDGYDHHGMRATNVEYQDALAACIPKETP